MKMNVPNVPSDEISGVMPQSTEQQPVKDPIHRPIYVDLIGVVAGILMLMSVGLWFTKLYAPDSSALNISSVIQRMFWLVGLLWILTYSYWYVTSNKQRKANLQSHRQQANQNYQLGQVRKEMDSRR